MEIKIEVPASVGTSKQEGKKLSIKQPLQQIQQLQSVQAHGKMLDTSWNMNNFCFILMQIIHTFW